MLVDIFGYQYSPNICARRAEVKALKQLPEVDKNKIIPLILLAPWPNAKELDRAMEKIVDAFGNRPFFLGLDRYFVPTDPTKPAAKQFLDLFDTSGGYQNYFEYIAKFSQCIPVLDMGVFQDSLFDQQIKNAERLGRGFLFHIHEMNSPVSSSRLSRVAEIEHSDFAFYLDRGWSQSPLAEENWYRNVCTDIFSIKDRAAVVVCSACFPKDFTRFEGIEPVSIETRRLSAAIAKRFNNSKVIHGDWASTRPRSYERASTPRPRVDYPMRDQWVIAKTNQRIGTFKKPLKSFAKVHIGTTKLTFGEPTP
jgi:Beta protein